MKIYVDTKLGVADNEALSLGATVAPNPASEKAVVHFFNPSQGTVDFELYSLQGQLMTHQSATYSCGSQQHELSLQRLPKGFYLLRIRHSDGFGQTVKVMVE